MTALSYGPRRRLLLSAGGCLLLSAACFRRAQATSEIEITMSGTPTGSHVWFRHRGLLIQLGQRVRWVNKDVGNVHTVTSYHPDNNKPRRIPEAAMSWNSDYLMPQEDFVMAFDVPGVYDYFCIPHEQAGMVGRIVVGNVEASEPYADTDRQLSEQALKGLPRVASILRDITVD